MIRVGQANGPHYPTTDEDQDSDNIGKFDHLPHSSGNTSNGLGQNGATIIEDEKTVACDHRDRGLRERTIHRIGNPVTLADVQSANVRGFHVRFLSRVIQ